MIIDFIGLFFGMSALARDGSLNISLENPIIAPAAMLFYLMWIRMAFYRGLE